MDACSVLRGISQSMRSAAAAADARAAGLSLARAGAACPLGAADPFVLVCALPFAAAGAVRWRRPPSSGAGENDERDMGGGEGNEARMGLVAEESGEEGAVRASTRGRGGRRQRSGKGNPGLQRAPSYS
jgi:hypothetical protein